MDYYSADRPCVAGGWANPADVRRFLPDVEAIVAGDHGEIEAAIVEATGQVQSLLRARYPAGWPWGLEVPAALRGAVARIAAYTLALSHLASTVGSDLADALRLERDAALRYVESLVKREAHPALPQVPSRFRPAVARPPGGEFGLKP